MTTATRSVAVVATRLPDTDRRALSQAWYSALHLSQPSAGAASRHPVSPPPARVVRANAPAAGSPNTNASAHAAPARQLEGASKSAAIATERRGPADELARRMKRAIVRCGALAPQQAAAVAVSVGEGRVHLLIRTDGATTRIVALCAPHLREKVDRALAHVRFALTASESRREVGR